MARRDYHAAEVLLHTARAQTSGEDDGVNLFDVDCNANISDAAYIWVLIIATIDLIKFRLGRLWEHENVLVLNSQQRMRYHQLRLIKQE